MSRKAYKQHVKHHVLTDLHSDGKPMNRDASGWCNDAWLENFISNRSHFHTIWHERNHKGMRISDHSHGGL